MCAKSKEQVLIENLFEEFYQGAEQAEIVGMAELSLSVDPSSGELTIAERTETVTATKVIYAWMESESLSAPEIEKNAIIVLNRVLRDLVGDGYFTRPLFGRSVTVNYTDNKGGEDEEMLRIDEEWTADDKPLMEGVDKELDDFFNKLMAE